MAANRRLNRFKASLKKISGLVFLTGVLITLFVVVLYVFKPAYLNLLELRLYDAVFQRSFTPVKTDTVAIVDIDDKSLEKFGQWPWPRYRVALLLQKINMAGALAVGLDILFAEPDGTSPMVMKKALKRDLKIDIQFSGMPEALEDNDRLMAKSLIKAPMCSALQQTSSKPRPVRHSLYLN